ncbi:MAG: hypothetical protein B7Y40_00415 [Gammaproteobacteria bacterium 28-57-27]|nr:MAG: hypothetical protein B7Y40_00415 [Gammaproteobacteria bacterium 28-57-27]
MPMPCLHSRPLTSHTTPQAITGHPGKAFALWLMLFMGGLGLAPAQAYTLDNCKGFSSSGHLECTTTPQAITAWRYKIPGYVFSTPYFPSEGQALANYKAQWAASIKTCKPITHTLGSFDPEWESVYGHKYTNWDYGQLMLARRKPYTITISDRSDTANGACVLSEFKPSHYLYHDRDAACAEGWQRSQDDPRSDFCFRFAPEEVSTSCPTDTPTLPGTGVKLLREDDSVGAGVHPLSFTRHYRSRWPHGVPSDALPMGAGWTHTYDRSIQIVQGAPTPTVRAMRGDGSWRTLVRDDSSATATAVTWRDNSLDEPKDRLVQHLNSQGQTLVWGYRPHSDDSLETYEANGRLRNIKARNGWVTTLVYSTATTPLSRAPRAGLLLTVRNHFGRELRLSYDSAGRIATLTTPDAAVFRYAHDALGNLTAVTAPGADANPPATQYLHYEDSRSLNVHALTGRTDALGVRVATYTYDALGQVASTEKAQGLDKLSFQYSNPVGTSSTIYYTPTPGAASTATQYRFSSQAGVLRPTSVTTPCPLCGASAAATSYDANKRRSKVVAHDGRVTFYTYNGWGRVTREATYPASYQSATTAPPLSAAEYVTHTQWHATWNLPLKVAEAYLITSYSYDSKGNLLELIETPTTDATGAKGFNAVPSGDTQTTRWTYDAKNLPVTIVELAGSTETGRWTLAYNSTGDVIRIDNLTAGTFATMSQYDAQGRMLEGVAEGGIPVSVTYDARGHVASITRENKTITFTYDARGLLTQANFPTGDVITLSYDSNGQFIEAFHNGVSIGSLLMSQRSAPSPALFARLLFHGREWLGKVSGALLPGAWAGPFTSPVRPFMPGFNPITDMMILSPMTQADKDSRATVESIARACQCNPNGGYSKPTLTAGSYVHLAMGGHLWPMFSDQSYFTTPVNQGLVDIAVATAQVKKPGRYSTRYEAQLPYPVGMTRDPYSVGILSPTHKLRIIVQDNPCVNFPYDKNEILTMYPIYEFTK